MMSDNLCYWYATISSIFYYGGQEFLFLGWIKQKLKFGFIEIIEMTFQSASMKRIMKKLIFLIGRVFMINC